MSPPNAAKYPADAKCLSGSCPWHCGTIHCASTFDLCDLTSAIMSTAIPKANPAIGVLRVGRGKATACKDRVLVLLGDTDLATKTRTTRKSGTRPSADKPEKGKKWNLCSRHTKIDAMLCLAFILLRRELRNMPTPALFVLSWPHLTGSSSFTTQNHALVVDGFSFLSPHCTYYSRMTPFLS